MAIGVLDPARHVNWPIGEVSQRPMTTRVPLVLRPAMRPVAVPTGETGCLSDGPP